MKLLVCGTQVKWAGYKSFVENTLIGYKLPLTIIEGECPDSADVYARDFAKEFHQEYIPFPAKPTTKGKMNYLSRNIEMVEACDEVLAFYDGWSYGTAQAIANAVMRGKPVKVVALPKVRKNA